MKRPKCSIRYKWISVTLGSGIAGPNCISDCSHFPCLRGCFRSLADPVSTAFGLFSREGRSSGIFDAHQRHRLAFAPSIRGNVDVPAQRPQRAAARTRQRRRRSRANQNIRESRMHGRSLIFRFFEFMSLFKMAFLQ